MRTTPDAPHGLFMNTGKDAVHQSPNLSGLELQDLETSNAIVPRYIRSLVDEGEALEACARRLAQ